MTQYKRVQPSFKLTKKTRVGARAHKPYHALDTPCSRLLVSDTVPAAMKDRLRALAGSPDPLGLLGEIRAVQHHRTGLAAGSTIHPAPQGDADLARRLSAELGAGWRAGEVRPTQPASQETAATLAYSAGSVRDDVARVSWSG